MSSSASSTSISCFQPLLGTISCVKIVFLNAYDARVVKPLREFLLTHKDTTDVFCFQETDNGMRALIQEVLPGFVQVSASKREPGRDDIFHNTTLVHASLPIETSGSNEALVDLGLVLYTSVRYKGMLVHIANVHGITKPGKLDFPARLEQSRDILDTIGRMQGVQIVGGDFNVLPETESVRMFEEAGYKNLIKDYGIKTTRNHIAWDKHLGNELYYSDYVFVKDAEAASFEVPPEIVSDHQPMILTVNLK